MAYTPQSRVKFRGVILNRRTKRAIRWAEKRAGFTFPIAQGSYNVGVRASAGTHDGGGAVDVGCLNLSRDQRHKALRTMKNAGFAAWFRPELPNVWGPHIHAILIGDKELGWLAADQVKKFDAGRDGLAGNQADNTYHPIGGRKWAWLRNRPVRRFK